MVFKRNFKFISLITLLFSLDQGIKLIVYHFYFNNHFNITARIFKFHPIINTRQSWGGNFISILSNPTFMIIINILCFFIFVTAYQYYGVQRPKRDKWVNIIFITGIAGCLCSLSDKLFWGGSLDYIEVLQLFIFDLKDCYLLVTQILFLIIGLRHCEEIDFKNYFRYCLKWK